MASAGHTAGASHACGRYSAQIQKFDAAAVRATQQWRKCSGAQLQLQGKRCVRSRAHNKTSLQLMSSEESSDGSILFRFGDVGSTEHTRTSDPAPDTQQSDAGTQRQSSNKTLSQPVTEPVQNAARTQTDSSPSDSDRPHAQIPAQQPAITDSEVEATGVTSLVEASDAEDSASVSERLWDMSPEQLENLKVAELKDLCKQEQVKGYSKLKKDELVSLLKEEIQQKQ